jgi:predicted phage-related endonuclease
MKIIEAAQGSQEWLQIRSQHFTASEAPAMLGLSKYKTRQDLLREKASGLTEEVDAHKQRLFDAGHEAEAIARPLAEAFLQEDLFPATGAAEIDGLPLLASFDGLNMEETLVWENKLSSAAVEAMIASGDLSGTYWPQCEQQMLVSGAERCLFTACDGEQITAQLWYESKPERRAQLIAGWKQFAEDLAGYQHVEVAAAPVAAPIKDLPAVVLTVSGALTIETNFTAWGVELRNFIALIPEHPATDQEFADCKAAVAAFKKAEAQLDAEEKRVLSMVADIDEMQREKKLLRDLSSTTRLALEKMVVRRDLEVKNEITQEGKDKLATHIAGLNKRLAKVQMPPIAADFATAIKGKRNIESMRGAVADLVAAKKIESNEIADKISLNLQTMIDLAHGYAFLFSDTATLVMKAPDDLALVIKSRIADHLAAEAKREEETRQRIRAEEEQKATAKAKAEQEEAERQRKASEDAAAKIERDRAAQNTQEKASQNIGEAGRRDTPASGLAKPVTESTPSAAPFSSERLDETPAAVAPDNGRRITVTQINGALGFTVTAEFLARLGFTATIERQSKTYRECDFPLICRAIVEHIAMVASVPAGMRKAA